jgi:DeoR family suf operon transcriptional repressor
MKSTRERILHTLVSQPRSTISELAEAVGINAISVRHHLASLHGEALITYEEERHGVGRPRLVYFLTEKGMERFPTRYFQLTNRLLDQIKGTFSSQQVQELFTHMAADLVAQHKSRALLLNTEQKLDLIKEILAQEGFVVDWSRVGDHFEIQEITCPYFHVGQSHPEVCAVDQTLISALLSIPAEKIKCVLHGDAHCTYLIPNLVPTP